MMATALIKKKIYRALALTGQQKLKIFAWPILLLSVKAGT
jgi:hypothetical protein